MESLLATEGVAIFVTGLMATLFVAVILLRNLLAGIMWSLSVILFIFAGLFGIGVEMFWLSVISTLILLMAGMVVRL